MELLTDQPASQVAMNRANDEATQLGGRVSSLEGHFDTLGSSAKDDGISRALDRLKIESAGYMRSTVATVHQSAASVHVALEAALRMEREHVANVNAHAKRGRGW